MGIEPIRQLITAITVFKTDKYASLTTLRVYDCDDGGGRTRGPQINNLTLYH